MRTLLIVLHLALTLMSLLSLPTQLQASSPLYVTIERSFSTKESPVFRLDTSNGRDLIAIRVLKPKDTDRFLDGQLELARSYEPVEVVYNPAHAFANGINRLESPILKLRQLINSSFRKELIARHASLADSVKGRSQQTLVEDRPETLIHMPNGFEMVKSIQLAPQFGFDGNKSSLNMGFDSDYDEGYKNRNITLPQLAAGLYLIQIIQGQVEAQALLQVSDLSVLVTRSEQSLVLKAINAEGSPMSGVSFRQRNTSGQWIALAGKTDEVGELLVRSDKSMGERLVFEAKDSKGNSSFTDTEFLSNAEDGQSLFMLTDRPIFKPGDQVAFKGIVREGQAGGWSLPKSGPVNVRFSGFEQNGRIIASQLKVNPYGSFSGNFQLNEDESPGLYQVQAEMGNHVHKGELRVRDYVKPTFYVTQELATGDVRPGQTATIKLKATRYAGGPVNDGRYEYYVYRKLIDIPQFVEDAGGALQAGMSYGGEMNRTVPSALPEKIISSLDLRKESTAPAASEEGETPASPEEGASFKGSWATAASFDDKGEAILTLILPAEDARVAKQEYQLVVMVRAMDAQGAEATASESHFVTKSEASVALAWPNALLEAGKEVELKLASKNMRGGPAPEAKGQVDIYLINAEGKEDKVDSISFMTDALGRATLKVILPKSGGQLRAIASLNTLQGQAMKVAFTSSPALAWNAPAGDGNQALAKDALLDVVAEAQTLEPQGRTRMFVLLPDVWGQERSGPVWVTVSGPRIHSTTHKKVKGYSTWIDVEAKPEYGTGFFVTVTVPLSNGQFAEATRAFSIINKDRQLAIQIQPEAPSAEPLKPFNIDLTVLKSDGQPATQTELSLGVVDKAIYDLQKEMRPSIYEFFYPTPRLNLMSFRSRDLQGYGYGDILRTANYRLKAIKSTSLFNALFRDTAGFFPHVVTDDKGKARVTVQLPANITEWVITAIAVDDQTRVGEATANFRTSTDISMALVGPQFIRSGEQFEFSIRYSNSMTKPATIQSDIMASTGLKLEKPLDPKSLTVEPKNSSVAKALLSAEGNKRIQQDGSLNFNATSAPDIHLGLIPKITLPILPAGLETRWMRSFPLAGEGGSSRQVTMDLGIPAQAEAQSVDIVAVKGMIGAVLARAEILSTYPYGCTEQLIHSTLPNVALLAALAGQTRISEKTFSELKVNLGPYQPIIKESYEKARLGLGKIIKNQNSQGGFGLFASDQASVDLTSLVADAFFEAQSLGFLEVNPALNKIRDYMRDSWWQRKSELSVTQVSPRAMRIAAWFGVIPTKTVKTWLEHVVLEGDAYEVSEAVKILNPPAGSPHINTQLSRSPEIASMAEGLKARFKSQLDTLSIGNLRDQHYTRLDLASLEATDGDPFARLHTLPFGSLAVAAEFARSAKDLDLLTDERRSQLLKDFTQSLLSEAGDSTYNAGRAILALRPFFKDELARNTEGTWEQVQIKTSKGQSLGVFKPMVGGALLRLAMDGPAPQGLNDLDVKDLPTDTLAISSIVRAYVPYKTLEAGDTGIQVERFLYKIDSGKAKPLTDKTIKLQVGDIVASVVRVKRVKPKQWELDPSAMIVIQDNIPSLFQATEEEKSLLAGVDIPELTAESKNFQTLQTLRFPDRIERIVRAGWWSDRPLSAVSVWRVAFRGQGVLPAASSFDMYAESVRGHTKAGEVEVL